MGTQKLRGIYLPRTAQYKRIWHMKELSALPSCNKAFHVNLAYIVLCCILLVRCHKIDIHDKYFIMHRKLQKTVSGIIDIQCNMQKQALFYSSRMFEFFMQQRLRPFKYNVEGLSSLYIATKLHIYLLVHVKLYIFHRSRGREPSGIQRLVSSISFQKG